LTEKQYYSKASETEEVTRTTQVRRWSCCDEKTTIRTKIIPKI